MKGQSSQFTDTLNQKHARSLITLAKWIESDLNRSKSWTPDKLGILIKLLTKSFSAAADKSNGQLGDLFDLATVVAPRLSKSWYALADWSFRYGQRPIELDLGELVPMHTSSEEKASIGTMVETSFGPLTRLSHGSPDLIEFKPGLRSEHWNQLIGQIRAFLEEKCPSLGTESVNDILGAYDAYLKNKSHLNKVACNSYFTFLKLGEKVSTLYF